MESIQGRIGGNESKRVNIQTLSSGTVASRGVKEIFGFSFSERNYISLNACIREISGYSSEVTHQISDS